MRKERRGSKRVPAKGCRVDFCSRGRFLFSKEISYSHRLMDISEGGVRFIHPKRIRNGTTVTLTIHQPHTFLPLTLRGRVAWSQPKPGRNGKVLYATGVEFIRLGPRARHRVLQLIDSLKGFFEVPGGAGRMAGIRAL